MPVTGAAHTHVATNVAVRFAKIEHRSAVHRLGTRGGFGLVAIPGNGVGAEVQRCHAREQAEDAVRGAEVSAPDTFALAPYQPDDDRDNGGPAQDQPPG